MSINHFNYGQQVALDWLQTGQPAALNAIFVDAGSPNRERRDAGDMAALGALTLVAQMLLHAEKSGVKFTGPLPSLDRVLYERSRGSKDYSKFAQQLLNTAADLRKACPGMTFSMTPLTSRQSSPMRADKPEPIPVQVVAMPARETTTSVTRDKADNILSTRQVERDLDTSDHGG